MKFLKLRKFSGKLLVLFEYRHYEAKLGFWVNCERIPQQAKITFVAESAILASFL